MLYNSFNFLFFFAIVLLIYFIIAKKFRILWLLLVSYIFYMCWNPKYAILLLFCTSITWFTGILLNKLDEICWDNTKIKKYKQLCVAFCFMVCLFLLLFFKYFKFILDNINYVLNKMQFKIISVELDIILPIGISFYIFLSLGYIVDVYRNEIKAEKNFFQYALFVSFFPNILAGPIERSKTLLVQIKKIEELKLWDAKRILYGMQLMLWGYFQKIVIADRIAIVVNQIYSSYHEYGFVEIFTVIILFPFQIYCDFSGYSNIARGVAQIMGIKLMDNFRQPYLATSIKEFWRRWHISLTSWFTDYLYIPLGGNRKGKIRQYANIMIVFLCSGLWHGANWTYLIWGGLHGIYQIAGNINKRIFINKRLEVKNIWFFKVWNTGIVFGLVSIAWIFFKADSLQHAIDFIAQMFRYRRLHSFVDMGLASADWIILIISLFVVFIVDCVHEKGYKIRNWISNRNIIIRWSIYMIAIWMIILFGIYGSEYDNSQFIYLQF